MRIPAVYWVEFDGGGKSQTFATKRAALAYAKRSGLRGVVMVREAVQRANGPHRNPTPAGGRVPRKEWRAFKTGLDYDAVRQLLWMEDPDSATWKHKGRGSVLGLWNSIKVELWDHAHNRPDTPAVLVVEGVDEGVDLDDVGAALSSAGLGDVDPGDVPF